MVEARQKWLYAIEHCLINDCGIMKVNFINQLSTQRVQMKSLYSFD